MDTKTCTMCNIEKNINNFDRKYSECKHCNRARGLERYYDNKDKISNQQKLYYRKITDRILLQKQNKRCIQFRDLVISYIELENKLKALEEKLKKRTQKNIKIFINEIYSKPQKKKLYYKQNGCLSYR